MTVAHEENLLHSVYYRSQKMETAAIETMNTEYAIFNVGDIACGVDINTVHEINRNLEITPVHLAPEYVRGVINLRGQIVTVIDLRKKFGMEPRALNNRMRVLVVHSEEENSGLLVDGVDDIASTLTDHVAQPPPHISSTLGKFLAGVYKRDNALVAILDVERILKPEDAS